MFNEYDATIREFITRSLEAAKQGRYAYICIQFEDEDGNISITYRCDKEKVEIEFEDE